MTGQPGVFAAFKLGGYAKLPHPLGASAVRFLTAQRDLLRGASTKPRPWHFVELHNPWSRASAIYDSWGFLDLCQSRAIVDAVTAALGPDIILYDSQWLPDPTVPLPDRTACDSDAHRCPVDPLAGVTALIGLSDAALALCVDGRADAIDCLPKRPGPPAITVWAGDVLLLDVRLRYRVIPQDVTALPAVYAVRYFPAASRYLRDPSHVIHGRLTERYPLLNYATLPLWLVHGEDRAANDFITGFNVRAGRWVGDPLAAGR